MGCNMEKKYLDKEGLAVVAEYVNGKENAIFKGTSAEWEALTPAEQAGYSVKCITDDESGVVVDAVSEGDMRAVTSNAVYDALGRPTIDISKIVSSNTFSVKALYDNYGNGTYLVYGQGTTGHGVIMVSLWTVSSDSKAYVYTKWYGSSTSTGSSNIGLIDTIALETAYYSVINKIVKITPSN